MRVDGSYQWPSPYLAHCDSGTLLDLNRDLMDHHNRLFLLLATYDLHMCMIPSISLPTDRDPGSNASRVHGDMATMAASTCRLLWHPTSSDIFLLLALNHFFLRKTSSKSYALCENLRYSYVVACGLRRHGRAVACGNSSLGQTNGPPPPSYLVGLRSYGEGPRPIVRGSNLLQEYLGIGLQTNRVNQP